MDTVADIPLAVKPSDTPLSLSAPLAQLVQQILAGEPPPDWNPYEDGPWAVLPSIPYDWSAGEELLMDFLTNPNICVATDYYLNFGLFTDHDSSLDNLRSAEMERSLKERAKDLHAALLWGQRCKPPWTEYTLKQVLKKASRIRNLQMKADDRHWSGRDAYRLVNDKDSTPAWAVEGLLLLDQPTILGGPEKTLKTAFSLDLAVSLTSATPFLGHFRVPDRRPVHFFSGESGAAAIRSMLHRLAAQRQVDLHSCQLTVSHELPPLADPESLEILPAMLRHYRGGLVIFDPAYLCLTAGADKEINPASLFDMGPVLRRAANACLAAGCTPLLNHHFPKDVTPGQLPRLRDLAFAGFREFARQWILVNRRGDYHHDGRHSLVMVTGGSAGHAGAWAVDVDEGLRDSAPTCWETTIRPWTGAAQEAVEKRAVAKSALRHQHDQQLLDALDQLSTRAGPVSVKKLRIATGLNLDNVTAALQRLQGQVEQYPDQVKTSNGASRKATCVRRVSHRVNLNCPDADPMPETWGQHRIGSAPHKGGG